MELVAQAHRLTYVTRGCPHLLRTVCEMIRNRAPVICLLTDSEVANSFCLRYWARSSDGKWRESFQTLLADSDLNKSEMIDMLKAACRLYFPYVRCGCCANPISVVTRSEYSSLIGAIYRYGTGKLPPLCTSCSTSQAASKQTVDFIPRQHRDCVTDALKRQHEKAPQVDYKKLSFFQSCILYAALLAANLSPGQTIIPPLEMQMDKLAPSLELADEIYARLCTDGIFLPALSSDLHAFNLDKDTGAVICNIRAAAWTLADDVSGRSLDEIVAMLSHRLDQPEPEAVKELWHLVAESECRRYFVSQWERYRFAHPSVYSIKVSAVIKNYLEQCSIGQLWNIVYYEVKNLAALTQEGRHTPQHIYNMLPGGMRRYAEYRLANGQTIRPWRRPSPERASWMTNILFDKIFRAGDICFEKLKGKDVVRYVEHLVTKTSDGPADTSFFDAVP
jgi:hypothetical protein